MSTHIPLPCHITLLLIDKYFTEETFEIKVESDDFLQNQIEPDSGIFPDEFDKEVRKPFSPTILL